MKKVGWSSILVAAILLPIAVLAEAQQPKKVPRIGSLNGASLSAFFRRPALRHSAGGLRELGYVEGKNIVIEWRSAEGKFDRLPALAAELVRLKVDVIVATGPAVIAAKKASATIPIVFAPYADPVGAGLVSSLARPGGNITGLSVMTPDLDGKRLELLKESFPKGCPGGLPLASGSCEGKPASHRDGRLRPRCWESNFNHLRCEALTILRAHLRERKGTAPRR